MAWYNGTYSCGHEGRINVIGPFNKRQWIIEKKFENLCPDCLEEKRKKEIEEKNKISLKKSKEAEYPDLVGTEKQVAWATTLRYNDLEEIYEKIENEYDISSIIPDTTVTKDELIRSIEYGIYKYTDAKFWIDNRGSFKKFKTMLKEYRDLVREHEMSDDIQKDLKNIECKLTLKPETTSKNGIVKIYFEEGYLFAQYPKDNDFIRIVKKHGLYWKGIWKLDINEFSGSFDDRAADLGNELLANGFTVRFQNEISRDLAISGAFKKRQSRWIKYIDKQLRITYDYYDRALCHAALKIKGAYYKCGSIRVPLEYYSQVIDFAELAHFSFSKKALLAIQEYKKLEQNFIVSSVSKISETQPHNIDEELRKKLTSSCSIIEDLRDD